MDLYFHGTFFRSVLHSIYFEERKESLEAGEDILGGF